MTDLNAFQLAVARVLVGLGIAHVPILGLICALLGRDVASTTVVCLGFAIVPAALLYAGRPLTTVSFAIAVALVGQTSLLVFAFSGHPWQVEMHFYYFAVLAMLSASAIGASSFWLLVLSAFITSASMASCRARSIRAGATYCASPCMPSSSSSRWRC